MRPIVLLTAALIAFIEPVNTAHADTGWALYQRGSHTYVQWHTKIHHPPEWIKAKAIRRARLAHTLWIERFRRSPAYAKRVIRQVFGGYAGQAIRVGTCESGLRYWAVSPGGTYRGIFQFGSFARARFGFAWNALTQTRAAWRYFVASGRDWSPWSCRP